jgi:uracil-DNA glycosylase family 4
MTIKRLKSKCKLCPLNETTTKVWGRCERTSSPKVVFLGEAPGAQEELEGKPFIGAAGRFLASATSRAGYRIDGCYLTNVICCRPPGNNIESVEAREAIKCCRTGLEAELKDLVKRGASVICALGNTARDSMNSEMKRGYLYEGSHGVPEMMTFHPAFILRGMTKEEPTWINDLAKVERVSRGELRLLNHKFTTHPGIEEIESRTDKLTAKKALIGVDIETSGFLYGQARIIVVGIASSKTEAFSIPFLQQHGKPYWKDPSHEIRAKVCVQRLMSECPTMMQNAPFDMAHLAAMGAPVLRLKHDLLLAHHSMSPELPHSLEYIASCFGSTPNWKSVVKDDARRMLELPDEVLRRYNLIDCIVLFQCIDPILQELREDGTLETYEKQALPNVALSHELTTAGIRVDQDRLREWKTALEGQRLNSEADLVHMTDVPPSFNWASKFHMRWLLFGERPASLEAKIKELASFDEPGCKRSKETKLYRDLKAYAEAFTVKPLELPRFTKTRTDSGLTSTDELALMRLGIAISNRLRDIKDLKRKTSMHAAEEKGLERSSKVLVSYRDLQETSKLLSTYTEFPTGPDGRVHPWYKIHGTATGRLSSSMPNLQNVPMEARKCFVPEVGHVYVEADFSNIELRVLALASNDDVLQAQFDAGLSIHDENCKALFGIQPDHPTWKSARKAIKTGIFGLVYGGSLRSIYEKVVIQVPELNLTYDRWCEIWDRYFKLHPAYLAWKNAAVAQILATRCVETAYGRKRYLLGDEQEILREGPNAIIQGTASEIVLEGVRDVLSEFTEGDWGSERPRLVACVHDSALSETPSKAAEDVASTLKRFLERPRDLERWGKRQVKFPVELAWSEVSWGEMKPWEAKSNGEQPALQRRRTTKAIRGKR